MKQFVVFPSSDVAARTAQFNTSVLQQSRPKYCKKVPIVRCKINWEMYPELKVQVLRHAPEVVRRCLIPEVLLSIALVRHMNYQSFVRVRHRKKKNLCVKGMLECLILQDEWHLTNALLIFPFSRREFWNYGGAEHLLYRCWLCWGSNMQCDCVQMSPHKGSGRRQESRSNKAMEL